MKLVILGANGRTGRQLLRVALERGTDVTAVVRSANKAPAIRDERLSVIVGDPCDPAFLKHVLLGQDVVISALGGRRPTKAATSVYYRSADAIVQAASDTSVKRVLVTSTALLFREQTLMGKLLRFLVPNVVRSASRMEDTLKSSGLDWTCARPGFLTDADTVTYRATKDAPAKDGTSVSRRALAEFLVDAIQDPDAQGATFAVSDRPAQSRAGLVDGRAKLRAS
ncbi:MAG: NAD(P)-binding oxidoreductase [Pseudomonadota bacterium]